MSAHCECGCGRETSIATRTYGKKGIRKGQPLRFLRGHGACTKRGVNAPHWKGGRYATDDGYLRTRSDTRPSGEVREHIAIVERVIGKRLPVGAVVHHVNGDRQDNRNANFVACQDEAYHQLLHLRQRALLACGHADWLKCRFCKVWDEPRNLHVGPSSRHGRTIYHRDCNRDAQRSLQEGAAA